MRGCYNVTIPVDGHPALAAVHCIQYVVSGFAGLGIGQFGGIQYFASVGEGKEYAQVEILISESVVQSAEEFRIGFTDNRLVVFINHFVPVGIGKFPHTRLRFTAGTSVRDSFFQCVFFSVRVIIKVLYLIKSEGTVSVELSD